eukprot:scaffold1183_cov418-Prasinococcus_capsulatus_cf.AAC.10
MQGLKCFVGMARVVIWFCAHQADCSLDSRLRNAWAEWEGMHEAQASYLAEREDALLAQAYRISLVEY